MMMNVHVEHTHEGMEIQGVTIESHNFHLGQTETFPQRMKHGIEIH